MVARLRQCSPREIVIGAVFRLFVLALIVTAGCATGRRGVLQTLPPPLATTLFRPRDAAVVQVTPERPTLRSTPISVAPQGWAPRIGISDRWNTIVIHHSGSTSGNADRFDRYHRDVKHWDELGYHFVIGNGKGSRDGLVEIGSRWGKQKRGAHCKTPGNQYNLHGIGICLVGDFRQKPPTPAQMASLTQLVWYLASACGIPPGRIVTHGGVTGKTACPGAKFPIHTLRSAVRSSTGASVMP